MHYNFDSIHDAAKAIEDAARYLGSKGYTIGNEVRIDAEYYENAVRFVITKRDSIVNGTTVLTWKVEEKKTLDLPDLTTADWDNSTSYGQLRKLYNMLGLSVTGGEITANSFLAAANKIREEYK